MRTCITIITLVGAAERSLELMCQRAVSRKTFGKFLAQHGSVVQDVARSRVEIDAARLMVLRAAYLLDTQGAKVCNPQMIINTS